MGKKKKRKGPEPKKLVFIDSKGYPRISFGPMKDVRLHTVIAEAMLGRKLLPDEDVHHKDQDKLNFHWTNLEVLGSSVHGAISNKQRMYFKINNITVEPLKEREPGDDDDEY